MSDNIGTVYLIRLDEKLANRAQYYLGFTQQHQLIDWRSIGQEEVRAC